jgi:hypothetical protein
VSAPIFILMHNDVTKQFGIKFKNQLIVKIHLNGKSLSKPDSQSSEMIKLREIKTKLRNQLNHMNDVKLKDMHDKLGIEIWSKLQEDKKSRYTIRYQVSEEIINKFVSLSNS